MPSNSWSSCLRDFVVNRRGAAVLAFAALLGLAGLGALQILPFTTPGAPSVASAGETPEGARPVTCVGRLEPEGEAIRLTASPFLGRPRVLELQVDEGDAVQKGQVLAVLDSRDILQAAARQAESRVAIALARLAQTRAGVKPGDLAAQRNEIERIQSELAHARTQYDRLRGLYEKGDCSTSELDAQRLEVDTRTRLAARAWEILKSLEEVREVDVRLAEAEVGQAEAGLERSRAELDLATVRSPIDGSVLRVRARPGESVGEEGIVELGRTQRMIAVAEVYETDLARVKAGQRATVTSDAFPGALEGTVERVGLRIDANRFQDTDPAAHTDYRVARVRIRLTDPRGVEGMTNLQVRIRIQP